ncbi:MAG: S8 family serine peptidase [Elusimicrobia bacterium]|nr:S8 family serine peptidase [Elusimicrobiota bacterium]
MASRASLTRLALLAAALLAARPASATKLDARLRVERGRADAVRRAAGAGAPEPSYRVLVRVAPGTTIEALRAAHPAATFTTMSGPVVTARVPESELAALEADPRVLSVSGSRRLRPTMNVARSSAASSGLYLGTTRNGAADLAGLDGTGVVVGVVDTGIDFRHADFIDPVSGNSRIQYLWDQTDAGGAAPTGVTCSPADCGTEWSNAQINASLPGGGSVREKDLSGHGTHVAGIAAGNGQAAGGPYAAGTFKGVAPKADLIVVKTNFSDAGVVDAINYIATRAAGLGKRAVVNLSLGGQMSPHDGTSSFETGVTAAAATTPVVVAMGNDGGASPHAQMNGLAFNQTVTFTVGVTAAYAADAQVDLWGSSSDSYLVTVALTGVSCGVMSEVSGAGTGASPFACGTNSVYIENASGATGSTSPADREMYVDVYDPAGLAISGLTVSVTCKNASGCGRLDGYLDPAGEGTAFVGGGGYAVTTSQTMASPATANGVIAVGSYASRIAWTDLAGGAVSYVSQTLGTLSDFSSQGPTRDGRQAPDVAAPGSGIASALSAQAGYCASTCTFSALQVLQDGKHAILQGTSMAAPVVTGIVALRLQGSPTRTPAELRSIVQGLARGDGAVGAYGAAPNTAFGYGKAVSSPQPIAAPSGTGAAALGVSSITWTWSSSLLGADAFDVYYATNVSAPLLTAAQPPFTQTGLLGNATYGLLLRGVAGGVEGPATTITTATFAAAPSGAPAATGWTSSVTVTFPGLQCPAFPAAASCSGYVAQVGAAADFSGAVFSSATTARTLTTLQVTGLTANTGYFLRLGTLNPLGAATWGPYTTFNTGTSLIAPSNPSFDMLSTGTIRFNWAQGGNPPGLTYVAQASTASDYSGTLTSISGTAFSATFVSLAADASFYFRVQAVGGPFLAAGPTATWALPPAVSTAPFVAVATTGLTAAWANNGDQPDTLYQAELSPVADFSSGVLVKQSRTTAAAFTGLTPNTAYWARVTALSRSGNASAAVVTGSTVTLVQTPTLGGAPFSAQAGDGFVFSYLTGSNPAGTRYLVQVSTDAAFSVVRGSSNTASSSAGFSGLLSNQAYTARVAGLNSAGTPTAYATASTATAVVAPTAAATAVTTRTATALGLAWLAGSLSPGTTYLAQVSSSPAFASAVTSSATLSATAALTALQPNTTYYGRVRALSRYAPNPDGPYLSPAAVATLPDVPGAAAAPFKSVFFTSATVAWTPLPLAPAAAAAEGYRVEFSTDPSFGAVWASSAVAPGAATATVSGLAYATPYYARVGSLAWDGTPNWLVLGSTRTSLPPLSSGTVSGSALVLTIPPAFPELTSIVVTVPPGAFPAGTLVSAVASISLPLVGARSNEAAGLVPLGTAVGLDLSAGGLQPASPVRVTMTYDPLLVPAGQDARRLTLWRYDPASAQWTVVPSQADARTRTLTASVQHFSTFAPFFVTAGSDLASVQVFPQPWEASVSASAYWAPVLTFSGMPGGARVRLFTLTGECVFDQAASAAGVLTWDGYTRYGKRAASGVYFAAIESGGARRVRRVVIVR